MTKRVSCTIAALLTIGALGAPGVAAAASHREAPAISKDPAADNADLYAWVQGQNLIIIATYNPLEEPAGGPSFYSFSDDVLYEIHIARGPDSLEDVITYQIRFTTTPAPYHDPLALDPSPAGGNEFFSQLSGASQRYTVTKIENGVPSVILSDAPVAPPNIGPRTNQLAYSLTAAGYPAYSTSSQFLKIMMNGEGRAWAGPRDDGFYVDLGHVFDLAGLCPAMAPPNPPCTARNNLAGFNVHAISLEIPLPKVNGGPVSAGPSDAQTLGVWASASRRKVSVLRADGKHDAFGPWVQVSRLGLPLINEVVIGIQDKDKYNRTHPRDDLVNFAAYILNPILVRDAELAGFYGPGQPLEAFAANLDALKQDRVDIVDVMNLKPAALGGHNITSVGDVLRVDLGMASGFPNGRPISPGTLTEQTDVTDVALTLILTGALGTAVGDGISANDALFMTGMPYLPTPWEGAGQGHFKP
ncbi:MAG: DUF4331 domain-containing protein [Polyangiaceae bacterium]|nr:DUF4331 domain-containing protein [Polyangiaceae bacterium]